MVPPPVVADLLERQRRCRSAGDIWSWQPESEADCLKARFLRRERALDAPHVGLAKAVCYEAVTIFFSDIVGFTDMSQSVAPLEVMTFLNELYSQLDDIISRKHRTLWKVETIGDSYMVAGGLMEVPGRPLAPEDSAREVIAFARQVLQVASSMTMPNGEPCKLRVGVHSGPASAGVVGSKMPRYCLFGETVNIASRMESTGLPDAIQVSERTWNLLGERIAGPQEEGAAAREDRARDADSGPESDGMCWRARGGVFVKGKGIMHTYVLERPTDRPAEPTAEPNKASARSGFPLELKCCGLALVVGCFTVAFASCSLLHQGAMLSLLEVA